MKKIMKKILLLLIFIFAGFTVKAQDIADKSKTDSSINIEGTYQIEVINTRSQPYIPGNLKEMVLEKRDATKIIYVQLGTEVRLKILPYSEIRKANFKPLPLVSHITE